MIKSIRSVLFATFFCVALLSLLLLAIFALPAINETAVNQTGDELHRQLELIADDFSSALVKNLPPSALQQMALKKARAAGSRITLVAPSGKVLADSSTAFDKLGKLENHLDRPEIKLALSSGSGKSNRYSATLNKELIYVAIPLKQAGKTIGFLRAAVSPEYASSLSRKINRAAVIALIISLIVTVILSLLLARYFAWPILRLAKITQKIANGNFPQTIVRKSSFEIRKLEEAVEEMSLSLADTFGRLTVEKSKAAAILSAMNEGVLAVNEEGMVILANASLEKTFGVIELDMLGKTVRSGLRNNEISDLIGEAIEKNQTLKKELEIVTPIQAQFIAVASPIHGETGEIKGVVCVLHDISEIKRLERYRSEFVANVSHELKTPLTAIRSYAETLLGGAIDDREHNREFVGKIDKHAGHLSNLIDDILEISKLEARRELAPFTRVDMGQVIERARDTISAKAVKKKIDLVISGNQNELYVAGIEDHLYRAVLNLLDNAINYSDEGGKVEVLCRKEPNQIIIEVSDNGIGISAEHLPRIFERFYRVDKARSRDQGGTGLGLAIVKHVINIHSGSVSVESQPDKGSRFTIILPLIKE